MVCSPFEGLRHFTINPTFNRTLAEGMDHADVDGEDILMVLCMGIFVQPRLEICRGEGSFQVGADPEVLHPLNSALIVVQR